LDLDRYPLGPGLSFFAIYTIIVLFDFAKKLRKRLVALSVLFAEKKEILLSLYDLFSKAKLPLIARAESHAEKGRGALVTESSTKKQVDGHCHAPQ
jgi:hypothetical protein